MPSSKFKEIDVYYSDIDANMQKTSTSDISLRINESDVSQAIKSLINTPLGSVPFRPDFGTNIEEILFEQMSLIQGDRIRSRIITAITTYEPRVNVTDVTVSPNPDENYYDVYIYYTIIYNKEDVLSVYIPLQSEQIN